MAVRNPLVRLPFSPFMAAVQWWTPRRTLAVLSVSFGSVQRATIMAQYVTPSTFCDENHAPVRSSRNKKVSGRFHRRRRRCQRRSLPLLLVRSLRKAKRPCPLNVPPLPSSSLSLSSLSVSLSHSLTVLLSFHSHSLASLTCFLCLLPRVLRFNRTR